MVLWITLSVLVAIVAVGLALPFMRRRRVSAAQDSRALAIARDQIAEIARDEQAGLIGPQEAREARREVEKRILELARAPETEPDPGSSGTRSDLAASVAVVAVLGWVVVGSALLYLKIGRPDLPDAPLMAARASAGAPPAATAPAAGRALAPPADQAQAQGAAASGAPPGTVEELIAQLAARLRDNPDDAEGWRMLGWSYFNTENYQASAEAYARAVALDASDPDVLSAYGEALVRAADGLVGENALKAFDQALAINPEDPRARFFKGMAQEQAGNPAAAIATWTEILKTAPPGAEWVNGLRQRIEELAAAADIPLKDMPAAALLPPESGGADGAGSASAAADAGTSSAGTGTSAAASGAPAPSADQVAAAAKMSPQDRQAMIRGMVDGLAARLEQDPRDPDGWIRLMRSRQVLGEGDAARAAYRRAQAVFADDAAISARIEAAARDLGLAAN